LDGRIIALMHAIMKPRYRLYRRHQGVFYLFDRESGRRSSLGTSDPHVATRLLHAKNEAQQNPQINRHIARAYLAAGDPEIVQRTWGVAMEALVRTKKSTNRHRWETAIRDPAFEDLCKVLVFQTQPEHLLRALEKGSVSTNVFLRRLQNFAVDVCWLPWPVNPKRQWPTVRYSEKRAIRLEEHQAILEREPNAERRAFYELCWHLGGSQGDIAHLMGEDVDWEQGIICYRRQKTKTVAMIHIGEELAAVLRGLPVLGPLFPYLRSVRSGDRATEFHQRCLALGIRGVTFHSYRYAWAERAKQCGYPERFAQEALGHNSQAVHRAYARSAQVILPSLEEYQRLAQAGCQSPPISNSSRSAQCAIAGNRVSRDTRPPSPA
jgi:integrase